MLKREKAARPPKSTGQKALLRGGLALVAGVVVAGVILAGVQKPHVYPVPVITQAVPAGQMVTAADLGTMLVTLPSAGAIVQESAIVGEYAQVGLYPGETVTSALVGRSYGVGAGQVRVVVPVTAADSALAVTGETVTVYGTMPGASGALPTVTQLVPSAKVVGVYTAGAVAITLQAPGAPALVALAVTPAQATAILPYMGQGETILLVARSWRRRGKMDPTIRSMDIPGWRLRVREPTNL